MFEICAVPIVAVEATSPLVKIIFVEAIEVTAILFEVRFPIVAVDA
jgi:hypothetical protein